MSTLKRHLLRRHRLVLILAAVLAAALAIYLLQPKFTAPIDSYAACVEAGYPVMLSEPPICNDGSHNFIGTPQPTAAPAAPVENLSFEILVNGDTRSQTPGNEQHYISNAGLWQNYWRKVHSGLSSVPPLLPVDFSKNDVIGVSLGQKTTGGYGLKVTSIATSAKGTIISVTETTPTITCAVSQQLSNRYVIVRTSKLVQPVTFRITPEKRRC